MARSVVASTEALRQAIERHQAGDLREAARLCQAIISAEPDHFDALHLLGLIEAQRGRPDEGYRLLSRALQINSGSALAHFRAGVALGSLKRFEEALSSYDRALTLKPDYAGALNNRGAVLQVLNRLDEALASYDRALAIKPDYAAALSNRGAVLRDLHRADEALASCDRALAIKPEDFVALSNRGNALRDLQCIEDALASYDRALAIKPDYAEARFNRSLCRLQAGDFERGWQEYEWRWHVEPLRSAKREFSCPSWLGRRDIAGKTLLLHAEQGFGDTMQFCRYAPLVAAAGADVILLVQPPLKRLLEGMKGVKQVIGAGETLPEFDLHCPLMSLPLAFDTRIDSIPREVPYLMPDPDLAASWRKRLRNVDMPKVGLVWAGGRRPHDLISTIVDQRRSMGLSQVAPLAEIRGLAFVSLQKDQPSPQPRSSPEGMALIDWTSELGNFADTAALVDALDLVISVDTSVAHLAAALGKPVWLLNRFDTCWRWLLNRDDSPWYPTLRIFRQPRLGDWSSVMSSVSAALARWRDARLARPRLTDASSGID